MDLDTLRELGEWAALGFYEARQEHLPWPIPYGRAYRRLYENMQIRVPEGRRLFPCEPLPCARNMESDGLWFAASLICDFNHDRGLRVSAPAAEVRKAVFPQHAAFIDALVADLSARLVHFGGYTHSNPDIRRVVDQGVLAMESELDGELAAAVKEDPRSGERRLLAAVKEYVVGVRCFHGRVVRAVRQAARTAAEPRRGELLWLAANLKASFVVPASNFVQGLLAVNFVWMLDGCDSIGRLDQALGALFERDLADGRLDLGLARELLDEMWRNFERFNGWNLQLGGCTPEGRDGCNRLTRECLLACRRNRFRRPNVALRIAGSTPDDVLSLALETLREGSGRPALYNDDLYIETLRAMNLGLTLEDAREIGFGGCTETMIAGLSNVGSLEGMLNLAKCLELALHDGRDPVSGSQEGPHTGAFADFATFDAFLAAVKAQIARMTDAFATDMNERLRLRFTRGDPKVYRTFFTRDCVKRRRSFEAGGARYNWSVVSYHGIANLIDSLAAVKRCVYEEGSVAAAELLAALKADFDGHDATRGRLSASPRFGNDDDAADALGRDILDFAWKTLYAYAPPRGGRYLASCILFATYANAGRTVGALPDGRRSGEPLADSVGPMQGRDRSGPTAMLNSVVKLPLWRAVGTPVLNIRLARELLESGRGLAAAAGLVRSYFARGGLQIQVSVLDREELIDAQRNPERHGDLIVRIGGYSEYFTRLTRELQDAVLARTEHRV